MKFIECAKKIEKKEVLLLLEKLNINTYVLDEFLYHYEQCNGGYPEQETIVLSLKNILPLSSFLPFIYGNLTIERSLEDLKEFGLNINTYEYLPFAICGGVGVYCLDLKRKGEVVLFIEEENRFFDCSWKSFSSFKKALYTEQALSELSENKKSILKSKIASLVSCPRVQTDSLNKK